MIGKSLKVKTILLLFPQRRSVQLKDVLGLHSSNFYMRRKRDDSYILILKTVFMVFFLSFQQIFPLKQLQLPIYVVYSNIGILIPILFWGNLKSQAFLFWVLHKLHSFHTYLVRHQIANHVPIWTWHPPSCCCRTTAWKNRPNHLVRRGRPSPCSYCFCP